MKLKNRALIKKLNRVLDNYIFFERRRIFRFQGVSLYPSEIHVLLTARHQNQSSVTKMADQLGISKGAVSKILTRLEKKGIVKKSKDPFSKNEVTVVFTPKGEQAVENFKKLKSDRQRLYDAYLTTLDARQLETINRFLTYMEEISFKLE